MQPNKVLSKIMHVKPLQEGEFVTYRLIEADQKSPNMVDKNDQPVLKNPTWVASRQTVVKDFDTGEMVRIGNVTSTKPINLQDGTVRYEDVTKSVMFNPMIKVGAKDFAT